MPCLDICSYAVFISLFSCFSATNFAVNKDGCVVPLCGEQQCSKEKIPTRNPLLEVGTTTLAQSTRQITKIRYIITCTIAKKEERKSIYIAPFRTKVHPKCSGMDHTVLPANNTMPAFPSWRSPDVTTTATEAAYIQLQLTTHLSTPKGRKALA